MTTLSSPIVALAPIPSRSGSARNQSDLIYIAGRLQYRSWEDKEGKSRRTAEIVASELILLDRKPGPDLRVVGGDEPDLPF